MALLSIAFCRLAQGVAFEALGAAQRARQIFQALRHRRGRLRSLELLQQAMTETMRALEVGMRRWGRWNTQEEIAHYIYIYVYRYVYIYIDITDLGI